MKTTVKWTRLPIYVAIATSTALWSCKKEEVVLPEPLEQGAEDVVYGNNHIILTKGVDNLRVKVASKRKITVREKLGDGLLQFRQETNGNDQFIYIDPKSDNDSRIFKTHELEFNVEKAPELTRSLFVTLRETPVQSMAPKYARSIGKGTKIYLGMGNVTNPIFDYNLISPRLIPAEGSVQKTVSIEFVGHSYRESMEKMSVSVGISGQGGLITKKRKYALSGSFNFTHQESSTKTQDFEFYCGYTMKHMADMHLDMDWVAAKGMITLLDTTVNNILNNPGSNEYQRYPNSKKGIYDLIDNYGTHIITKGAFGGTFQYLYGRSQNSYETTVSDDASAQAKVTLPKSVKTGTAWVDAWITKNTSSYLSANVDASFYSQDYQESSKEVHVVQSTGGNGDMNIEDWDDAIKADKPDTWVLIKYSLNEEQPETDSRYQDGLIELWEVAIDPERQAAIKTYLPMYLEENYPDPEPESKLVVVDFMMKNGKNGHVKGDPKAFVATDEWGIKRIYYPMMGNENAPTANNRKYALETSSNDYIVVSDEVDQYWYYALGHSNEGYGVTDIVFSDNNVPGYTRRGDHADANNGFSVIYDRYVWLKLDKAATKGEVNPKWITAIGLYDSNHSNKIIASTGGSEWATPFANNADWFNNFWKDCIYPDTEHWYQDAGLIQYHHIKPCYTTKPLEKSFRTNGDNTVNIQHPKKWGDPDN